MLEQVNAGAAGNAGQNCADTRCSINGAVNLEEAVHRADFFHIFVLYAIQPQRLLIAEVMRLDLRNQGRCIVAAALGKAGAARAGTRVLILDEDFNRIDAGGIIRADRRADNQELVGLGGADTQMRLRCNDERTDVQRCARLRRNPVLLNLDKRLDCLNEILDRQRRQAHAVVGVDHALRVAVRTEQLHTAVRPAIRLQTFERLHCVVQNHSCRINGERLIRYNACIMPADSLGVVDDEHIVRIVNAESQMFRIRFFLFFRCRRHFDVKHFLFHSFPAKQRFS